jgi:hypothetical protein
VIPVLPAKHRQQALRSSCWQTCGGYHKLAAEAPQTANLIPSPDFAGRTLFPAISALRVVAPKS